MERLSAEQSGMIIGTLLGDGAMRCKRNALLEINHCWAQRAYVDWKYRLLAPLVAGAPKARRGNGGRLAYRFLTRSIPVLTPYYKAFYAGGRKSVPEIEISPIALATWFMDDGCKSRSSVYLNTQQFDMESQERLLRLLSEQWGIDAALNRDKQYYRIRIATGSMSRFRSIVRPHLLPEFFYKMPV